MKLYTNPISSNGRRAVMVLKITGLPCEVETVDLAKGAHLTPAYLALNPNHKVPSLTDGDLHLWESGAICQYLAAKAGRTDLWPTDPAAQADVSRWMLWNHTHFAPPISAINGERLFKRMFGRGEPDEAVVLAKLKEFDREARVLDGHLVGKTWIAQGHLTLADIQLGCTLSYAAMAGMSLSDYPEVARWFAGVQELPAWKETAIG